MFIFFIPSHFLGPFKSLQPLWKVSLYFSTCLLSFLPMIFVYSFDGRCAFSLQMTCFGGGLLMRRLTLLMLWNPCWTTLKRATHLQLVVEIMLRARRTWWGETSFLWLSVCFSFLMASNKHPSCEGLCTQRHHLWRIQRTCPKKSEYLVVPTFLP
jgi:hypothetical protein